MKIQLKRLNSRGFAHHLLIPVIAIFAVAGIGAYVISKSKAGTIPYGNGSLYVDNFVYSTFNSTATNRGSATTGYDPSGAAAKAFPNECSGGVDGARQTWSTQKQVYTCLSSDSVQPQTMSVVTMNPDFTGMQIVMQNTYSAGGSSPLNMLTSQAFIKDGSMSKIAFIEQKDASTTYEYRIGIYDTVKKVKAYLKDGSGKDIVSTNELEAIDWSPDGSNLYLIKKVNNSDLTLNICNIPVIGGTLNCITPKNNSGNDPLGNSSLKPIWSYDLSNLYINSWRWDATTNTSIPGVYKFSTQTSSYTKLSTGSASVTNISPDSKYLVLMDVGSSSLAAKVYNTVDARFETNTLFSPEVYWQVTKLGTPAPTIPPDSGPVLTANYQISCKATFGKLSKSYLPVTVAFTNMGPDYSVAGKGFVKIVAPNGTVSEISNPVPGLSVNTSSTWSTQTGPFTIKGKTAAGYTLSAGFSYSDGRTPTVCSGTKTL